MSLVLSGALAAATAFGGEPPKDMLRDDVAALVAWVPLRVAESLGEPEGPSPTVLTARIVARGDGKVRPELKTLWRLAAVEGAPASERRRAVEEVIRFLYGTGDPAEPPLRMVDGAVVVFPPKRGDYDFGSFDRQSATAPRPPSFDELVKGGKLRAAPKPLGAKLLAALQRSEVAGWGWEAREALARATGETCTGAAAAKLVELAAQQPTDATLATALAWSAAPEAEAELRRRVASLAARVADGKDAAKPLLASAVAGLHHVKPQALRDELDRLPDDARAAAVGAGGTDLVLGYVLDRAEQAGESGRSASLDLVRAVVADGNGEVPADAGARLVAFLQRAALDAALRDEALRTAETLLYGYNRYPIRSSSEMNGIATTDAGERVGPYPGIGVVLDRIAGDLAAGAAVFQRRASNLWDEPAARLAGEWVDARSDVPSPHPGEYFYTAAAAPVGLAGEFGPEGLKLTLTNRGAAPFALNATSLGWGCGEVVTTTIRPQGGKATSFTSLGLKLGFVRAPIAVPAERLVVLAPGGSHTWTVALRNEDRAVDHVSVEVLGLVDVVGKPAAPLLRGLLETWVK